MKAMLTSPRAIFTVLIIMFLASCSKKQDTAPTNLMPYRTDASQAQTLDISSINSDMVLDDKVNGVDYIITHNIEINANLTIKPGVTLMFADGAGLQVNASGSIFAQGDKTNLIYFTSKSGKRNAWKGVTILSGSSKNILSYCKIEHGGYANDFGTGDVIIGSTSGYGQAEISNSEITASGADGIVIAEGSRIISFANNNIHTNTAFPLNIHITDAINLMNNNTYANNGKEFIKINGSGETLINKSISINKLSEAYLVSKQVNVGSACIVKPGVRLFMDETATFLVNGNDGQGSFTAIGSKTDPILITAQYSDKVGFWGKIAFLSSRSTDNDLEYCTISGGGAGSGDGMITVSNVNGGSSAILVRNCTIMNSSANGVYIQGANTSYNLDIATANTFSNNTIGNVQVK